MQKSYVGLHTPDTEAAVGVPPSAPASVNGGFVISIGRQRSREVPEEELRAQADDAKTAADTAWVLTSEALDASRELRGCLASARRNL